MEAGVVLQADVVEVVVPNDVSVVVLLGISGAKEVAVIEIGVRVELEGRREEAILKTYEYARSCGLLLRMRKDLAKLLISF